MKGILLALSIGMLVSSLKAQDSVIIKGRVDRLTKSAEILISGNDGTFTGPIQADGSFLIRERVREAGPALIRTDSSGAGTIWLQPGEYWLECKEISLDGLTGKYFRMPNLIGPEDARDYHRFFEPLYYMRGGSREETAAKYKRFYTNYLDSLFITNRTSPIIPELLRTAAPSLGDSAVKQYMTRMNEEQSKDDATGSVKNYLNRKEKIARERYFEDFTMKQPDGRSFRLSSLKNKLLLIDFWSSDCVPCRYRHRRLAQLYKDYAAKGLEIISVSLDDNDREWKAAIAQDKMVWINVSELKGWQTSLTKSYFINSIPYSIWLDGNRRILTGELSDAQVAEWLNK